MGWVPLFWRMRTATAQYRRSTKPSEVVWIGGWYPKCIATTPTEYHSGLAPSACALRVCAKTFGSEDDLLGPFDPLKLRFHG